MKSKWIIRQILIFNLFNCKVPIFKFWKKYQDITWAYFQRKYVSTLKRYYEKCHVWNTFCDFFNVKINFAINERVILKFIKIYRYLECVCPFFPYTRTCRAAEKAYFRFSVACNNRLVEEESGRERLSFSLYYSLIFTNY